MVETADVPIIKMRFMAIMVDISIGQLAGFCTLHFMNYADKRLVARDGLLKRSAMLLKTYFSNECSLLGS